MQDTWNSNSTPINRIKNIFDELDSSTNVTTIPREEIQHEEPVTDMLNSSEETSYLFSGDKANKFQLPALYAAKGEQIRVVIKREKVGQTTSNKHGTKNSTSSYFIKRMQASIISLEQEYSDLVEKYEAEKKMHVYEQEENRRLTEHMNKKQRVLRYYSIVWCLCAVSTGVFVTSGLSGSLSPLISGAGTLITTAGVIGSVFDWKGWEKKNEF